jgi:hypothetical protein
MSTARTQAPPPARPWKRSDQAKAADNPFRFLFSFFKKLAGVLRLPAFCIPENHALDAWFKRA